MSESSLDEYGLGRLLVVLGTLGWFGMIATGCGGGGNATQPKVKVSIDELSPQSPYPNVETTVDFSLTPQKGVGSSSLTWRVDFGDATSESGSGKEGSVTHQYEGSGTYGVRVVALVDGKKAGSASETLEVLPPVDVAVTRAQPNSGNVQAGGAMNVSVEVRNQSATPIQTPFDVELYLTESSDVSADTRSNLKNVGTQTVEAPGEDAPVVGPATGRNVAVGAEIRDDTEAGEYYFAVWVSPDADLSDDRPDNNFHVGSQVVRIDNESSALPDLAVRDLYAIPERAYPALNQFRRGYTLANEGGAEAFEVTTRTYLSTNDAELDDSDTQVNVSEKAYDVPSGESIDIGPDRLVLDQDVTPPNNGEREVHLIVEAEISGGGEEASSENNSATFPITVTDEPVSGPDLVAQNFSVSPQSTFLDGSLQVDLQVANQGKGDIEQSFICGLYLGDDKQVDHMNDPRFSSINITSLASQASTTIERTVTIPAVPGIDPGDYYVYAFCDPNGTLQSESFRSNNSQIHDEPVSITDQANVDLFVDSLDVPETVQEDEQVTVTANVCVSGMNPSGETTGRLYQTVGTQVDFEAAPLKEFQIPNINPGSCQEVDVSFEADCQDFESQYAHGVEVDVRDDLPEKDEDNNTFTASRPMTIRGDFCKCEEDEYEPNNKAREAVALPPGQSSAAICKPGSCDYFGVDLQKEQSASVETTFNAEKGDLETTLFDTSGVTQLDVDDTPGRQRVGTYVVPVAGRYVFKVCGENNARNLYDMNVDVLSRVQGVDVLPRDVQLPSRDTFSLGATIPVEFRVHNLGRQASGSFKGDLVVSPDRNLGDGNDVSMQPVTVDIPSVSAGGKVDVQVGATIPSSLSQGDYYIGIVLDSAGQLSETNTSNNTVLSRNISIETECYDPLEPNDNLSQARSIQKNTSYSNLLACASEDDYYELCLQDGRKFSSQIKFDSSKGDIDFELYDQNQNIVASSARTGVDKEQVSVDYVNGDQCYYLRAFVLTTQNELETNYQLSTNVQEVDPSLRCQSHFEPNNSFSSASSLIAALQQSRASQQGNADRLGRCPPTDTDFYHFRLQKGQKISLRGILEPKSQPGTLRLQLYEPNQQPSRNIETAPGVHVAELKDYVAPRSGRYHLQVTLTGNKRRATYRLEADGLGGVDLAAENLDFWGGRHPKGSTLRFDFEMSNLRADDAQKPSYKVYLGDSANLNTQQDTLLKSVDYTNQQGNRLLSGNRTVTISNSASLPSNPPSKTTYVHVLVETDSSQTDPNTGNNVSTKQIRFQ
jgi:hypothetical protein